MKSRKHIVKIAAALALLLPPLLKAAPGSGETPGIVDKALGGAMKDVEEIIFAVRGPGREWHFYANFGYVCQSPQSWKYGGGPGQLWRLNVRTKELRVILEDANGAIRDPDVHYDGEKILFSYRKGGTHYYHLYEINIDGTGLKQLTDGPWDDIEVCYLPNGEIVFSSSRCKRYVPCLNTQVAILHKCAADGSNIRRISANVESECTPAVMPDGRVIFMRWEYVNRGVMEFHHLWTVNPDGTGQMTFFGNMYDKGYGDLLQDVLMTEPRAIPGSNKVSAIFSDKHGKKEHLGHVFTVDPKSGPDALDQVERVSQGFPGTPEPKPGAKPDFAWRDPYPFSENCFLAASYQGIYVMDGDGNFEMLYSLPQHARSSMWVHEPRPLLPREREQVIPDRTDWTQNDGTFLLTDVHIGRNMDGVEPGTVADILVLEILPAPVHFGAGNAPIGDNNIKRVLGTVPVASDGSAYFKAPAGRALSFVARDKKKHNVKIMNSFVTLMPGETTGCVGCHEQRTMAPPPLANLVPEAMKREADKISPVPGVPDIIGFNRHIQPLLDKHCVKCHNPKKNKGPNLNGEKYICWSNSYRALSKPWNVAVRGSNTDPYSRGTASSKLLKLLEDGHKKVKLNEAEMDLIRLWIDCGGIYAGTYGALGNQMLEHEINRDVLERRCYSCHVDKNKNKKSGRGPKWPFEKFFETDFNITKPEKSKFLLTPLAEEAGGRATSADPGKSSKRNHYTVFKSRDESDFRALEKDVKDYIAGIEKQRWYGTPNWRPNKHYIREMIRYGVLPDDFDSEKDPIDPFETDRKYFDLFSLGGENTSAEGFGQGNK